MEPPIQALILLAILAASAIIFTVVFVIVADRKLAEGGAGESTGRSEEVREEPARGDEERKESDGRIGREDGGSGGGRGA